MSECDDIIKMPVGISSCLLGEKVRFDGGHKNNPYIVQTLSEYFRFVSFCPEVTIGLGVPRETIRLIRDERDSPVRCVGTKNSDLDVTNNLIQCAQEQMQWIQDLSGYIFKKDSPSCGMERVKVYRKETPERNGVGIFADVVQKACPALPVEEEGRLGDALLRENFIQRVFIYHRWRQLLAAAPVKNDFVSFHARHKLIYMSHNQDKMRALGQLVADISVILNDSYIEQYQAAMTDILRKPASRRNHVNTLQHIQGYLKRELDHGDKRELTETIDQYRLGRLPLIVPITLLKHHFRHSPNDYIDQQYYMQPHPSELMLRNTI